MRAVVAALALAACGIDEQPPPDPDAGGFGRFECDVRSPLGPVHVRARAGDTIVSHSPEGIWLDTVRAGADGAADIDVPGCGQVTAVSAARDQYVTIQFVEPGETLRPWGAPARHAGVLRRVTVQLAALPAGTLSVDVSAGAGCRATRIGATEVELAVDASCTGADGTLTIAAVARTADAAAVATLERAPIADAIAMPAWRAGAETVVRALAQHGYGQSVLAWSLAGVVDGRAYPALAASVHANINTATATAPLAYADLGARAVATFSETVDDSSAVRTETRVLEAPLGNAVDVDFAKLPPRVGPVYLFGADSFAVTSGIDPTDLPSDVDIVAALGTVLVVDATRAGAHWRIVAPAAGMQATIPTLPTDLRFEDLAAAQIGVTYLGSTELHNYRVARVSSPWARGPRTQFPTGLVERTTSFGPAAPMQ